MSAIEVYTIVVVHLTLLPVNAFPLAYSRSPWRSTDVGRALMLKGCSLAALYDLGVAGFWWTFGGYAWFYAAVVTVVGLAITYQLRVMLRLQRRGRHEPSPHGEF